MIYTVTLNPALDKEYHVPQLIPETVLRAVNINLDFGGKGFNIARMLSALGSESVALGFVGGHTGNVLREGLQGIGIQTDFVEVKGETRTNFSIVADQEKGYYKVNEAGPEVSAGEVDQLLQKIEILIRPGDWWVLAGSLPMSVPDDIYAVMIDRIQNGGAKAVLDSSGEAMRLGCQSGPFLIKPNMEEISQITGQDIGEKAHVKKALSAVHESGVKNIILSAGREKSICSNGEKQWIGQPPRIKELNPIGAGDALLATVVHRLSQGNDLLDAFIWGMAAGAAAASKQGTRMPTFNEVQVLLDFVVIAEE